jgi:hypothetical protein
MSRLEQVILPELSGVTVAIDGQRKLTLKGTIASRDPAEDIAPLFKRIHAAIVGDKLKSFEIDLSGLTFVNSSAIRLFVDWVTWVKHEPPDARYQVVITMNSRVTWQKTSLIVLKSLAADIVELKNV